MMYKYIVKNVAKKYNKTVTFMPKPLFGDNGSGMHTHASIWKGGENLYAGSGYAGLSDMAIYAIGGLLKHARALSAIIAPTTNSYKRLVPGYEAPVNLAYSRRNRSAACRIPMYSASPKTKRVEFRPPDPSANPYLAFACMLGAGLKGVEEKLVLPKEASNNIFKMTDAELKKALSDKDRLYAELQHRVKNSLALIVSLLSLEAGSIEDEEARAPLEEAQVRVRSIALLYEQLYRTRSVGDIDLGTYLAEVARAVAESPIRTGVIGVSETPVSNPRLRRPPLK